MGAPRSLTFEELRMAIRWEDLRVAYFEARGMWEQRVAALANRERYFYEFQEKAQ